MDPQRSWLSIRGLLVFGVIWLATMLPIAWLPAAHAATGQLVVEGLDALLVIFAIRMLGGVERRHLDPRLVDPRYWRWSLFALIVLIPINLGYHQAVTRLLGIADDASLTEVFLSSGFPVWAAVLSIVVQPAIIEELGFRGIVQGRLTGVVGAREAVVISALAFGIIHMAWFSTPYLVLLGLVLGWLRVASGSLLPCMLLHALHNAVVLILDMR
ncbi:MAG: CPBP family intramembrane metalloprotease [Planctomycetes bacterium]|nr:CPBP family intramembrane metalloprotease [Planctomycetota bacterium]